MYNTMDDGEILLCRKTIDESRRTRTGPGSKNVQTEQLLHWHDANRLGDLGLGYEGNRSS